MSIGAFTDRQSRPTEEQFRAAIGRKLPLWERLVGFIRGGCAVQREGRARQRKGDAVQEELKFQYGRDYGWALCFRGKGRLLTALYPSGRGLTVQIVLSPAAIEQALRRRPGPRVRAAIEAATPYAEGRWLFVPVESAGDLRDVERLLGLKLEAAEGGRGTPAHLSRGAAAPTSGPRAGSDGCPRTRTQPATGSPG